MREALLKRIPVWYRTGFHLLSNLFCALIWPFLLLACLGARFKRKSVDVGLGPHPLINNVYHKRALGRFGYTAETFVTKTYHITNQFDVILSQAPILRSLPMPVAQGLACLIATLRVISRYRILYIYFNGGPLSALPGFIGRSEPLFLSLAGVKTVVMPYGGDVQELSRSQNLYFKHTMAMSYPNYRLVRRKVLADIDRWTCWADHVLSGVEWVDYMYHWDTLMVGHFSIDTNELEAVNDTSPYAPGARSLRLLHAPNHRHIKGTESILKAVEELRAEGHDLDIEIIEKRPNEEVLERIRQADVVLDQLVIGWYAMFSLEAMALGKPIICYIRPDLVELYEKSGLLAEGELPFLDADTMTIKTLLRSVAQGHYDLAEAGKKSRRYVEKHHSLDAVGAVFDRINRDIGVSPSAAP